MTTSIKLHNLSRWCTIISTDRLIDELLEVQTFLSGNIGSKLVDHANEVAKEINDELNKRTEAKKSEFGQRIKDRRGAAAWIAAQHGLLMIKSN